MSNASKFPPPPVFTIVRHATYAEIERAYWQPVADGEWIGIDELLAGEQFATDADGNKITFSTDEVRRAIETVGCWGFVTNDRVIHVWIGENCRPEHAIHMLAHEIAHWTGDVPDDPMDDEMRSEQFGAVAAMAFELFEQLRGVK